MKTSVGKFVVTVLVFPVFGSFAQAPDSKADDKNLSKTASHVKIKYDKSKDLTTVTLKPIDLGGAMTKEVTNLGQVTQLTLEVFFTYPGERPSKPVESLTMRFISRARFPVFQRGQTLMAVLDDVSAIPLGDTSYKTNAQTFYTDGIFETAASFHVMKRISGAKKAMFFLGNRQIALRESWLQDLRDITTRMA